MEWLGSWLLSVTCAALIAALCDALCPEGLSKKLTRIAGGLLLLLAALGPVRRLDEGALTDALERYRTGEGGYLQVAADPDEELIKSIIARETAAYISDKAAALGIEEAKVSVRCRLTGDGFAVPESVAVRGRGKPEAWDELTREIAADFSLEKDAQTFERMDTE